MTVYAYLDVFGCVVEFIIEPLIVWRYCLMQVGFDLEWSFIMSILFSEGHDRKQEHAVLEKYTWKGQKQAVSEKTMVWSNLFAEPPLK